MTRLAPALLVACAALATSCDRIACGAPYAWVDGACVEQSPWPAACPENGGGDLDRSGLLFIGGVQTSDGWGLDGTPIESQEALDALLADMIPTPEIREVDFDTEVVIGAYAQIGGTCAARVSNHGLDGATTLVVQLEDDSGTCVRQCDMGYAVAVLYAIPRPATSFTVCTEVVATCE